MNDDRLRRRIADADPTSGRPDLTNTDPGARALLEDIMNTPYDTIERDAAHDTNTLGSRAPDRRPRRWYAPVAGIAAAGVLVVGGLAVTGNLGGADGEPDVAGPVTSVDPDAGGEPVTLSLGEGQDAMMSCMAIDAAMLGMVPLAFAGDVSSIDGELVTMTVTQWYVGGDAPTVQLTAPAGLEALIGTVDFEVGGSYLISSGDGQTVNYCGWSGPATPELQAVYDAAFPG